MKLTRCDYCGKELLEEYYYTTTYPVYTMGGWAGDKHFCSPFCVSEYFYELDEKAKEKKQPSERG